MRETFVGLQVPFHEAPLLSYTAPCIGARQQYYRRLWPNSGGSKGASFLVYKVLDYEHRWPSSTLPCVYEPEQCYRR
jgi:hypothetical protein